MVFSSFTFLFLFLPIFLLCYYPARSGYRNFVALIFSYIFYAWGAPHVVIILFLSSIVDYYLSKLGERSSKRSWFFELSIFLNVALLIYYKYTNFALGELNLFLQSVGFQGFTWKEIILPIGVSFFTFQKISYLYDVYCGKCTPAEKLWDYLLYVALFPQLIAGPIVRYRDIASQIKKRSCNIERIFSGVIRFSIGIGKKVLIADEMGRIAENVFNLADNELTAPLAWLGLVAFAFQVYYDFSGYSDMAIGLGRMMGFELLENFNFPYLSQNITEFWRRWHMSLSRWMKEYLYIPLGGNRRGTFRTYLNLWIVFLISGLWHGASWNFVFWGMFHGFFLIIDKLFWLDFSKKLPKFVNIAICFFIVLISWVFFRADNFQQSAEFLEALFGLNSDLREPATLYRMLIIHNRGVFVLTTVIIGTFLPVWKEAVDFCVSRWESLPAAVQTHIAYVFSFFCLILAVMSLAVSQFSPFLYFRF